METENNVQIKVFDARFHDGVVLEHTETELCKGVLPLTFFEKHILQMTFEDKVKKYKSLLQNEVECYILAKNKKRELINSLQEKINE